jgi:hypothetical protein
MSRAIKLIFYGAIGALGMLRGAETLIVVHAVGPAILPAALGLLFAALFAREFRKPTSVKQR